MEDVKPLTSDAKATVVGDGVPLLPTVVGTNITVLVNISLCMYLSYSLENTKYKAAVMTGSSNSIFGGQ